MKINSLCLKNFRNYEELYINFNEKTNIIYGDNAQGKTNILEAIFIAATTKSHRSNKDQEIIRFEENESRIEAVFEKNEMNYKINMLLRKNKGKSIAINGVPIKRAAELFGIVNIVFFSPQDLNMIKDGPVARRKFIDMELSQIDKIYLNELSSYNKILMQRNKLLKDLAFFDDARDTLEVWDQQLVHYGTRIIRRRAQFIKDLNEIIGKIHQSLSGNKEELRISYEPAVKEDDFADKLASLKERDLKMQATGIGPHKDDICFYINGKDVRKYGSQGQQRTAALSLKLSEIELVKRVVHDDPILLLDDVLSELDSKRQNYLLNNIKDIQTIVTCTGLDELINNRFEINKIYNIVEGKVVAEN